MNNVYINATNMISSLGFSTEENFQNMLKERRGISIQNVEYLWNSPFPVSLVNNERLEQEAENKQLTRFEKLLLVSAKKAVEKSNIDPSTPDTLFLLSTTKGNVDLLDKNPKDIRAYLWSSAKILTEYFKNKNKTQVVSSACISGLMATIIAHRLIATGHYKNVVVTGADVLSKFIVSGFMSFHSLSKTPCKPFDLNRDGLSLGEGAGTIVFSSQKNTDKQPLVAFTNGSISNDANHISGPSRTGDGLAIAIKNTLKNYKLPDFISAHGTATLYNDDMESKALTISGLQNIPTNSFKGYIGHTLGAAGVIETIMSVECLRKNQLLKTIGLEQQGVAQKINVITQNKEQQLTRVLKLVSGFGGTNAAALFTKINQ